MLVRVLDGVRQEAKDTKFAGQYALNSSLTDDVWAARARAYIHLYLKVVFGLRSFVEREHFITDGGRDGGIDGYYVDRENRTISLIQSKFRHSEENFERKPIELTELLNMEIRQVLNGEQCDEEGFAYNGKIKGMQRALTEIPDLGRYNYKVIFLANLNRVSNDEMLRLTDRIPYEIINYDLCYKQLLYPVMSGAYFKAKELSVTLELSNKSTGSKIGYTVSAAGIECEITVVYVPTMEIGRVMSAYRNSILVFNPRSYLEFEGQSVNRAIRDSIEQKLGNEFALLNNGLTIICEESGVNDRSGQKGKAQFFLLNPQIINGGQTAYSLSRIYDSLSEAERETAFKGKEVLVKAIAVPLIGSEPDANAKRTSLIESISAATNSQTAVTIADRSSGDPLNLKLQEELFQKFGLIYERKRGEFADAIRDGYLSKAEIVDRAHFARIYLAANGHLSRARTKRVRFEHLGSEVASDNAALINAVIGLDALKVVAQGRQIQSKSSYRTVLPQVRAAVIASSHFSCELRDKGLAGAEVVSRSWPAFLEFATKRKPELVKRVAETNSDGTQLIFKSDKKKFGPSLGELILKFFANPLNLFKD